MPQGKKVLRAESPDLLVVALDQGELRSPTGNFLFRRFEEDAWERDVGQGGRQLVIKKTRGDETGYFGGLLRTQEWHELRTRQDVNVPVGFGLLVPENADHLVPSGDDIEVQGDVDVFHLGWSIAFFISVGGIKFLKKKKFYFFINTVFRLTFRSDVCDTESNSRGR